MKRAREGSLSDAERDAAVKRIEQVAYLLDSQFRIPGTSWRIGLDGLVGLIPGIGDAAGGMISAGLVAWAWRLGVSRPVLLRMAGNVALDVVVGAIPVLGDLFDVGFKANRRNAELLLRFMSSGRTKKRRR